SPLLPTPLASLFISVSPPWCWIFRRWFNLDARSDAGIFFKSLMAYQCQRDWHAVCNADVAFRGRQRISIVGRHAKIDIAN
ncbi:hypothetical protein K6U19_07880, partial [Vibrio fluvialis]